MSSTEDSAAEQVAQALLLVNGVLADPRGPRVLLNRLGWDLPPGADDIGLAALDLSAALTAVMRLESLRAADASDQEIAAATADLVIAVADTLLALSDAASQFLAPAEYLAATDIVDEFVPRLADLAVIQATTLAMPMVTAIAQLCGVFVIEHRDANPAIFQVEHVRHTVRWDRLGRLFSDPGAVFREVYGWGTPNFRGEALLRNLANVLQFLTDNIVARPLPRRIEAQLAGVTTEDGQAMQLLLSLLRDRITGLDIGFTLFELRPTAPAGADGGFGIAPYVLGTDQLTIPLAAGVSLALQTSLNVQDGIAIVLRPGRQPVLRVNVHRAVADVAGAEDKLVATLRFARGPDRPVPLLSLPGGLVLEASTFVIGGGMRAADEGFLRFTMTGARLGVPGAQADAFMAQLLGDRDLDVVFDLGLEWSPSRGLTLHGSGGLSGTIGLNARIGPLLLHTLRVAILALSDGLAVETSVVGSAVLGPVTVDFDGVGVRGALRFQQGNLGPIDLSAEIVTPRGLDLRIAAGPVSGGGFIGYDGATGRYTGGLALRLGEVAVRAVGLLDTRLPGGGFSLVVWLSARFPGIQLGFGVMLTGVGGLVGVNRRIAVDVLRERFATGAAGRLLAAEDPLADLPALLTELALVFPPADGVFVVGPTLQLTWLRLVTLDVGVFLEFPGPTRVVVLGTARATVDNPLAKGPLVQLRADFVGVLDLERATFAFDATLIDSRLLESFPLTGDILFRAGWGDEPYTVLSVGGFHPDFHPGNLPVPKTIDRLAMSYGHPDDRIYLRFEGYFAITSNSVQFGASVEVSAKLGPFRITGFIGFDALIRFEPFYFTISFQASVRLKWKGRTLAGISVKGTLSGPGPVKFTGRACVEVLFFDICKSGSFEIGSDAPPVVRQIPSALTTLALELRDPANLRAAAEDRSVVLRALPADPPVLAPTGVIWEQTRAPLGLLLERFEGTPLGLAETVTASSEQLTGEELDWFAPGSFSELSDAEALTRRSFERLPSGVRLAAGADEASAGVDYDVEVVEFLLPAPAPSPLDRHPSITVPGWLLEAVQVREGLAEGRLAPRAFETTPERWRVVDVNGSVLTTTGESQAHQLARSVGRGAVALPVLDQISLTDA